MRISSEQNARIKSVVRLLEKSKERKQQQQFVVEGIQENKFALENNFIAKSFYLNERIFSNQIFLPDDCELVYVTPNVYEKIAYRKTTEGIIGVYEYPTNPIDRLIIKENITILALESIEKPGNLGAALRSADAFGVDAVFVLDELVDFFNPNVIRASVGSVFTVPVFSASNKEFYDFCNNHNISIFGTFMNGKAKSITEINFQPKSSILFGTESTGISDFWHNKLTQNFLIPMCGRIDSLNISNAVAISLYEASRQKKS